MFLKLNNNTSYISHYTSARSHATMPTAAVPLTPTTTTLAVSTRAANEYKPTFFIPVP